MSDIQPRFSLQDDGRVFRQADSSNPLPGEAVTHLVRGVGILQPGIELAGNDAEKSVIEAWLQSHIASALAPLMTLKQQEGIAGPVREICDRLYDALGISPREELESAIAKLDPEMRRALRDKKVKLGPVLIFLPELNKPAAVHLRAVLWSLYNGRELPPPVPADGIVSFRIDEKADPLFYRTVGYPVYGPRACRIDMLDRVINAIYGSAQGGKFKAEHKMAEWLGSSIEDLYAVLEAMGHKKIPDPAPEVNPEEVKTETPAEEIKTEKPALATFFLKKGRASDKPFVPRERKPVKKTEHKKQDKKPFRKKEKREERQPRILTAEPKNAPADSPFAILQQLKIKSDGQ